MTQAFSNKKAEVKADRQATDRQNAVTDAADPIAEYLWAYYQHTNLSYEDRDCSVLLHDVETTIVHRLAEKATEAAKEASLDAKAEELGLRY